MGLIWTVAWYEFKLILRSRVYRLFAVIALITQIAATLFLYVLPNFSRWGLRAVPSSIPYTSVLLFDLLAAVGAIFLSTEFLNRDLTLGTTDTVYYRDFSAPKYLAGKGFGILAALLGLEGVVMLVPFVANLFFVPDTPVSIAGYVYYPLLLTVPMFLFIMGISWLVMLVSKSQALTFMAVTIVFGTTLWANRFTGLHHVLDFPGLRIPALYSDFVGFGDPGPLLVQRGLYALFGIGLMAGAPLMLPRLPQSRLARSITGVLSGVLVVTACALTITYMSDFSAERVLRDDLRALNHAFDKEPRVTMDACDLTVDHRGETIHAEAAVTVRNDTGEPLDSYLFSLNPGLVVETVTGQSGILPFSRNQHLITVTPPAPLAAGAIDSLVITYAGAIDQDICYLDTSESERTDSYPLAYMPVQRMSGTITPDCVVLTPETLWYPVAGVPYGSTFPDLGRKDFPRFSLTVSTGLDMVPVSQGVPEVLADGRTVFHPSTPMSQLSLNIAAYDMQTTVIDSITYSVYYLPGHDYYASTLEEYKEGLPEYVRQQHEQYEMQYYGSYPFDYFTIAEVPIQFAPRLRTWTLTQDNMQPGIALVNERGAFMQDLAQMKRSLKSLLNAGIGDDQIERIFISNTILRVCNESYDTNTSSPSASRGSVFSRSSLYRIINTSDEVVYNAFPNYYTFTNNFSSERWPIIDSMLERYLALRRTTGVSIITIDRFSAADVANMLLAERSMPEILSAGEPSDVVNIIVSAKLNQLFAAFSARIGSETLDTRIKDVLSQNRFDSDEFTNFLDAVQDDDQQDIASYLDEWYHAKELPICRLCDVTHVEIPANDRINYQLMVTLSNPSNANGLFQISGATMSQDDQGGRGNYEQFERYVEIPGGETRCVCITGDAPFYREVTINSLVSQNLPAGFSAPIPEPKENSNIALQDTVLVSDQISDRQDPDVIIVDDISPGCVAVTNIEPTWFQRMIYGNKDDEEFRPLMLFSPYNEWMRTFDAAFYGNHIRSGLYKAPGDGSQPVVWTAQIPETGTYDVYAHARMTLGGMMVVRSMDSTPMSIVGTLLFTVHHDDGSSPVEIQPSQQSEEWSYLGSYYFSEGEAKIELSDKSDGQLIFADAVKWEKR